MIISKLNSFAADCNCILLGLFLHQTSPGTGENDYYFFFEGKTGTNVLQKATVPILSDEECLRWHEHKNINLELYSEMFCAGHSDGRMDACLVSVKVEATATVRVGLEVVTDAVCWVAGGLWRPADRAGGRSLDVGGHHQRGLRLCRGPSAWNLPQGRRHIAVDRRTRTHVVVSVPRERPNRSTAM